MKKINKYGGNAKSMYGIKLLMILLVIFIINGCTTDIKDADYNDFDPFYLAQDQYVRNGDPYTGEGFMKVYNSKLPSNVALASYALDGGGSYDKIIPLRKPEIVRRIYIYPRRIGDVYSDSINIYVVMSHADWN